MEDLDIKPKIYEKDFKTKKSIIKDEKVDQKEKEKNKLVNLYNQSCFNSKMSLLFADLAQTLKESSKEIKKSNLIIRDIEKISFGISNFKKLKNSVKEEDIIADTFTRKHPPQIDYNFYNLTTSKSINSRYENEIKHTYSTGRRTTLNETTNFQNKKLPIMQHYKIKSEVNNNIKKLHKTDINQILNTSINHIYRRKKNFTVKYDKSWYKHKGLLDSTDRIQFVDKESQRTIISTEILILIENISKFKLDIYYKISKEIHQENINNNYLVKINKLLEETCGLMMNISHIILYEYERYIQSTENALPSYPNKMKNGTIVTNEAKAFDVNITIFYECEKFLSSAYEIFLALSSQVKDYIIAPNKMVKLKLFLDMARFNVSNLVFTSQNYIRNSLMDQNAYDRYCFSIKEYFNVNEEKEKRTKIKEMNEVMRERLKLRLNDEVEKNRRLNSLELNSQRNDKEDSERRRLTWKKKEKHIDLNSNIFKKMMQYMNEDKKRQILGEKYNREFGMD